MEEKVVPEGAVATRVTVRAVAALACLMTVAILLSDKAPCAVPRPLKVAPGETASGQLAYCIHKVPPHIKVRPADINTGQCAPTKKEAEALLVERRAAQEREGQACRANASSPLGNLWDVLKRMAS